MHKMKQFTLGGGVVPLALYTALTYYTRIFSHPAQAQT